jgi:hypothetical protein
MTKDGGFGRRFFILTKYRRNAALPPMPLAWFDASLTGGKITINRASRTKVEE